MPAAPTLGSFIDLLRCPASGRDLVVDGDALVTSDGSHRYRLIDGEIPAFAEQPSSAEARKQRAHYDRIAAAYQANLLYPHTIEYMAYLDDSLRAAVGSRPFGVATELCCGHGEAISLFGERMSRGLGLDISDRMLKIARESHGASNLCFVQGDATDLPLASAAFDTVFMLGGIHHVPNRQKLFSEVARILKPGGRFIFREPVSDFWPWRLLRALVYRVSPTLDHENEWPLRFEETEPPLTAAGLRLESWTTHGFLGFCVFMNSDVLVVNRLFRFIPGIRAITRAAAWLDSWMLRLPGFRRRGLQVIGCAVKA